MKVRDAMQHSVITVAPEAPLREAATKMLERGISGLPVVGPDGLVLGVISEGDFVVKELGSEGVRHRPLSRLLGDSAEAKTEMQKIGAITVREAMTAPPVTIDPDGTLRDAAALMIERHINRLPVLEDGRLVGIVTRADVVRAFMRPDEELEKALRAAVVKVFWVGPSDVSIDVRMGVAHVSGMADTRTLAELIERFIVQYDGVVGVAGEIAWRIDVRAGSSNDGPPQRQ